MTETMADLVTSVYSPVGIRYRLSPWSKIIVNLDL